MKTIQEIKNEITQEWMSNPTVKSLYKLDLNKRFEEQFSKVSLESILFYCIAYGIYLFTQVLSFEKTDIENTIKSMKPHSIGWYIDKIKQFQLGDSLSPDSDTYPVIDESKQIIKYCNIVEKYGYLIIKIAGEENGLPAKLDNNIIASVSAYIDKIKDAGVHYELICRDADLYKVSLRVYYDPLVLNDSGARIDGAESDPIKRAVMNYIQSVPFDSRYSNMALIDALQGVEGVVVADVLEVESKYYGNAWTKIASIYNPDAGYMKLEELKIEYIAY